MKIIVFSYHHIKQITILIIFSMYALYMIKVWIESDIMDIKKLLYFKTIVEEGNITSAAKKLRMAQPPLSHQLKLFENELGVKLIERGSRKVKVTDAGKILYKRAKQILDLTDTTIKEIDDFQSGLKGTLSIGTVSSSGTALLTTRLINFHKTFPKVRFEIHEGNTYELIELLTSGIIEVAIVRTPFNSDGFECIYLDDEPMIAVTESSFDFKCEEETINFSELKDQPLIIYRRFEKIISSICHSEGFEPQVFCINDDARTTLLWAAAGLGVAIVPKSALNLVMSENLNFKIINESNLTTRIAAIWIRDKYLSSVARSFLEVFK